MDLSGHHLGRQDAHLKLVPFAQAFGERGADLSAAEAQLVGEILGRVVEVGEVVLPALDRAARGGGGILGNDPLAPAAPGIVEPRESGSDLRCGGEEFLHLLAVDPEVGETLVGHAAHETVEPANDIVLAQGARVEVEALDHLHQHAGGQRALVPFDEVEVGGRDAEQARHRGLGQALALAQPAQRGSGEEIGVCHVVFVNFLTNLHKITGNCPHSDTIFCNFPCHAAPHHVKANPSNGASPQGPAPLPRTDRRRL